jgi:hypothetical protein
VIPVLPSQDKKDPIRFDQSDGPNPVPHMLGRYA